MVGRMTNCLYCGRFCRDNEFRFDPKEEPIGFICDGCDDSNCPGCGENLSACTCGVSDMNNRIAASRKKEALSMKKFEVEFECFVHESRLATVEAESKDEAKKTVEDGEFEDSVIVGMKERIGKILSVEEVKE